MKPFNSSSITDLDVKHGAQHCLDLKVNVIKTSLTPCSALLPAALCFFQSTAAALCSPSRLSPTSLIGRPCFEASPIKSIVLAARALPPVG